MSEPDLSALLRQAQQMQEQLLAAQAEAASAVIEGRSGGGAVRVQMSGGGEVQAVRISPDVVDPTDVEMLEDLIVAALHDAATQVAQLQAGAMGGLGGLASGGLGGLFGQGG